MPRHTRPPAQRKHPRSHIRAQRDRYARRRFAEAKRRLAGDRYLGTLHIRAYPALAGSASERWLQDQLGQAGPVYWVHPEMARRAPHPIREHLWIFGYPDGELTRNPHTRCSCWACQYEEPGRRGRERRAWSADVDEQLHD